MSNEAVTKIKMTKKYLHIMRRSPALKGRARQYGRGYAKFALVESDQAQEPCRIDDRINGVRVIRKANVYYGKGIRSEGVKFLASLIAEKEKLETETNP